MRMRHEFTAEITSEMRPIPDGPKRLPPPTIDGGLVANRPRPVGYAPLPGRAPTDGKKIVVSGVADVVEQLNSAIEIIPI